MMSKQALMTSLILSGGVISIKLMSLLYMGIKNEAPKAATAFRASFCGYSVVMLYLRGFQLMRVFFQPERIASVFNSGEYGKIVASIDFVGTKSYFSC